MSTSSRTRCGQPRWTGSLYPMAALCTASAIPTTTTLRTGSCTTRKLINAPGRRCRTSSTRRSRSSGASVRKRHAGEARARFDQSMLRSLVASDRVRGAQRLVIEIFAAGARQRLVADRKPRLGQMTLAEVVGCAGPAHAGCDPARLERVGTHGRPAVGDREGENHVVQLAFGVGLRALPTSFGPQKIVEVRLGAVM